MTDEDIRWKQRFANFVRALERLEAALALMEERDLSELEVQGTVKAFEFTHELAWNLLKDYLEYEGIQGLVGSRSTLREAFKRGLVDDGSLWMDMIDKRNLSSHTYNPAIAEEVVRAVSDRYIAAFVQVRDKLGGKR